MKLNSQLAHFITALIDFFYFDFVEKLIPRHTFRYGVCGAVNILVLDTLFYYLIYHYIIGVNNVDLGLVVISPHVASLILVFPITFFIGFWLNRFVAFNSTQTKAPIQIAKYALSVVGSLLISYFCLKFFVEVCHLWATPAKTISSLVTTIYSYLAARYFTFGKSAETVL